MITAGMKSMSDDIEYTEALKAQEKDYKTFVEKLGAKELSELDPDEIRLKLNQIVDWNDKKVKEEQ